MYVWNVYYENADTDEPARFIGTIWAQSMAQALQRAGEFYEFPSYDLVVKRRDADLRTNDEGTTDPGSLL